jgi:ABC-type dipeptide/oligopeptide/nickel transport system permease subunit
MNEEKRNLQPSDFEFVQADSKIYDKKFETKPIGYFKDAMIRFSKNRTNVIASSILGLIILGTILIPIFSPKNFEVLEAELAFLPPKIPILENWGMYEGTSQKENIPVDLTTIDPETGLGLPITYQVKEIDMDSLINYYVDCTDRDPLCQDGENILSVDAGATHVSIVSEEYMTLTKTKNPSIEIDIFEFTNEHNSVVNIYVKPSFTDPYTIIGTTDVAGILTIDPFALFPDLIFPMVTQIKIELVSTERTDKVAINSVAVYDDSQVDPIFYENGYELSQYTISSDDDGAGLYVRSHGQIRMADFTFINYVSAFGSHYRFMPASEYNLIMDENPQCVSSPHPDTENYPNGWVFEEGCPVEQVFKQTESVVVEGVEYYSFETILNYQLYKGYEEIPYYFFGTDLNGRDLFTLLWVATRTSLMIGLVVAMINVSVGVVYGAISGYYGGTVDLILQRITEVIGRIPWLVTLSIFVSFFGPGVQTLILILIVSGWIGPQAVTRTQFYRYKGREYVLAARTLGAKDSRLIFRHILPNGIGTIITSSVLMIPGAIFAESTISFLGFGIGHGQKFNVFGIEFSGVSVGVLLSDGRMYLLDHPHLTIYPAILISILMITFNMFGNALRDAFNPALRGSE